MGSINNIGEHDFILENVNSFEALMTLTFD